MNATMADRRAQFLPVLRDAGERADLGRVVLMRLHGAVEARS